METINKFIQGVHDSVDCGTNMHGYAALEAVPKHVDFHSTDSYPCFGCVSETSHSKKKPFTSRDTVIYMLTKLVQVSPSMCTYLLIFARDTNLHGTLSKMTTKLASRGNIIVVVEPCKEEFVLNMYHRDVSLSVTAESIPYMYTILQSLLKGNVISMLCYPCVEKPWMELLGILDINVWCTTATKYRLYSSVRGNSDCSHFMFPWSRYGIPTGYTLGRDGIQEASQEDRLLFEGKGHFYDSNISSVKYNSSCTDCEEMKKSATQLSFILDIKNPCRPRPLSQESIVALEFLNSRIRDLIASSP